MSAYYRKKNGPREYGGNIGLQAGVFISAFGMVLGMFFDQRNCFVGFPWGFMKVVLGGRRRSLGSRWVWYNSVAQNAFVA